MRHFVAVFEFGVKCHDEDYSERAIHRFGSCSVLSAEAQAFSVKQPSEVQQVELSAQTPLPLAQDGPGLKHSWGLYASNAQRAATGPPMLHPMRGEQQILGPRQRPERVGPQRVHSLRRELAPRLEINDRFPPGGQFVMKQPSLPLVK